MPYCVFSALMIPIGCWGDSCDSVRASSVLQWKHSLSALFDLCDITYLTSTKPNRLQAKISNWFSFFLIKSADTNKKRDKNTDRCSMVTFWKVAALPCTGVLAPICSCWHKASSFSSSVITTVFSSSTNWNRERYTQREGGMSFRTEDTVL